MDKLDNLAKESLDRYFHTLSVYGYTSYQSVYKEILLLFIEDLLSGPMSLYINEKDETNDKIGLFAVNYGNIENLNNFN